MRAVIIALTFLFASAASAATITVVPPNGDTPAFVALQGPMRLEDIEDFRFKVAKLSSAIVALESDGGNLLAGIRIGEIIRLKGFFTVVSAGARCASACAIAWLGGAQRFMGEPALIGFHAAYREEATGRSESGMANAVLGAYLYSIGLPESAIAYITMAAPSDMNWLTLQEAAKYGIEVRSFPARPSATASLAQPRQAAAPEWERRTQDFIGSTFAAWSAPFVDVIATFGPFYADQVFYYGNNVAKNDVLADKARFVVRWPQRKYVPRTEAAQVQCNAGTCSVTGLVDWETFNPSTSARARGTAQYQYAVAWTAAGPRITLETSMVIAREKTSWPTKQPAPKGQ